MKLKLTMDLGNAAFSDGNAGREVARILHQLAVAVEQWSGANQFEEGLWDVNGNRVGEVKTTGRI
jgi:hypothetical protein